MVKIINFFQSSIINNYIYIYISGTIFDIPNLQILMNSTGANISEGFIQQLYLTNKQPRQPIVQILDFEESETNDKQITLRISDKITFIDCTLSGPYQIQNGKIVSCKSSSISCSFKRYDFVKINDYFSKIDQTRICKLKIIIRKLSEQARAIQTYGMPQEMHQYIINHRMLPACKYVQKQRNQQVSRSSLLSNFGGRRQSESKNIGQSIKVQYDVDEDPIQQIVPNPTTPNFKIEQSGTKLFPQQQISQNYSNGYPNMFQSNTHTPNNCFQSIPFNIQNKSKKQENIENVQYNGPSQTRNTDQSLTLRQIMSGVDGFLIGRLIRFKCTIKQTKDSPMTVIYLGFIDKYSEIVRVHLAGRLAMNNEKIFKKNKCYYVKGFQIVFLKGNGNQIRLKDKQYKIYEINNEELTKQLKPEYYHWDHQNETAESEYVDIIGIVDDVEEKATYNHGNNPNQSRVVIRIVIKNIYKSVRISFWSDQIKVLEMLNLKRKEPVIIEDVKKKQSKYYDYSFQSNLVRLDGDSELKEKYSHLLPIAEDVPQPQNIKQLSKIYEEEPNNGKLRTINAYLFRIHENKILFKICQDCKRKVDKSATKCQECNSLNFIYKYNCPFQFSDSTGSIVGILFDSVAQKLFNRTAIQISKMQQIQLQQFIQTFYYRYFTIVVQNRNQRLIIRSLQSLDNSQYSKIAMKNAEVIRQHLRKGIW